MTKFERVHKTFPAYLIKADEALGIAEAIVSVTGIVDLGDDVIDYGAYAKTVQERAGKIRVLDNHQWKSVTNIVGKPLEIREVPKDQLPAEILAKHPDATGGLYTKTQYFMDDEDAVKVFRRVMNGVVEYSIGFDIVQMFWEKRTMPDGGIKLIRRIKEVRLIEYSPVILGMNQATATISAKDESPKGEKERTGDGQAIMRLGDYLMGCMRSSAEHCYTSMFRDGWLNDNERTACSYAIDRAMEAFKTAMPDDLLYMDIDMVMGGGWFMWNATNPDESKAGRVLSSQNATDILSALNTLQDVLKRAGVMDAADDADTDADATEDSKSQDVPPPQAESQPELPALTENVDMEKELMALQVELELLEL